MKQKFIDAYIDTAFRFAELSSAKRLKVGAIIVKDDRIISIGYNGTPSGWSNDCENLLEDGTLKTKPEVIHAEMNAIFKLAKCHESGKDASLFLTHSPCMQCATGIYAAGIKEVFYKEDYRDDAGILFLQKCNINVIKV